MKIGFTGTRNGMTEAQRTAFVVLEIDEYIVRLEEFHHGSCKGADVEAARGLRQFFKPVRIIAHPGPDGNTYRVISGVDDETRPGKTHFARNRDIVDETDHMIACPGVNEWQSHGGTFYTMSYAIKKKKPLAVIWPDGHIEYYPPTSMNTTSRKVGNLKP